MVIDLDGTPCSNCGQPAQSFDPNKGVTAHKGGKLCRTKNRYTPVSRTR